METREGHPPALRWTIQPDGWVSNKPSADQQGAPECTHISLQEKLLAIQVGGQSVPHKQKLQGHVREQNGQLLDGGDKGEEEPCQSKWDH